MNKTSKILASFLISITIAGSFFIKQAEANNLTNQEIVETAEEAYIFGYPLMVMDLTKEVSLNTKKSSPRHAPINTFGHMKHFPDYKFKNVVKPNVDTFYSSAWIDLSKEPIVLDIADTKGRYFMIQFIDAYTDAFFVPGSRTTGTKKQRYVLVGPDCKTKIPRGMKVVKSKTNMVWAIGRTQVNSPEDGKRFVSKIQDGYKLTPLSKINSRFYLVSDLTKEIELNPPVFTARNMNKKHSSTR